MERDGQWTTVDSQDYEETIPVEVERERIIECSYDALQCVKPRHLLGAILMSCLRLKME